MYYILNALDIKFVIYYMYYYILYALRICNMHYMTEYRQPRTLAITIYFVI